jgi:hypothetical protein
MTTPYNSALSPEDNQRIADSQSSGPLNIPKHGTDITDIIQPQDDETGAVEIDYWGFQGDAERYELKGGQYFEFRRMTEGMKAKYQKLTTGNVKVQKGTGDAIMQMDPSRDRHALITTSVENWYIKRQGRPQPFSKNLLEQWLLVADPEIVDGLEKAIRTANPWLKSQLSAKEIKVEIANLQQTLEEAEEREAGEAYTSSR